MGYYWRYEQAGNYRVAHDYPQSDNEVVSAVNELISKIDTVASIYDNLKKTYKG